MEKGKIFISSTVSDFEDLRSALKYWLSEMGYDVYTSETCDFPKDSSENSYQACFSTIEKCDWYILLIGSRYGSTFRDSNTDEEISITQAEYRTAYKFFTEGKIKRIIPFVRRKVWIAKQERSSIENGLESKETIAEIKKIPSPNADVPEKIFSFIDEVSKSGEMVKAHSGEIPYPRGNWINVFNGFSDIVDTLRIELNMSQRLSTLVYTNILTEEIKHNLKKILVKNSHGTFGMFNKIRRIREKCIEQLKANNKTSVCLTNNECAVIAGTFIGTITLEDYIIKECHLSGVFLDYDPSANRYRESAITKCLVKLEEAIGFVNTQSEVFSESHLYFLRLYPHKSGAPNEEITIEYQKIAPILSEHDQLSNVLTLSIDLLSLLHFGKSNKIAELYPLRLCDNFEIPENCKALYASYDEFYGKELSDRELDELIAQLTGEQHEA